MDLVLWDIHRQGVWASSSLHNLTLATGYVQRTDGHLTQRCKARRRDLTAKEKNHLNWQFQ